MNQSAQTPTLRKELSLLDAILVLMGGVIGTGIFLTAGQIATELRQPGLFLLVWIAGGVISLLACFAVAELGSMFPHAGGQYVFLREAYGPLPAFLYGWMIFAVIQTGAIAAIAVGFAQYFVATFPALDSGTLLALDLPGELLDITITSRKLIAIGSIALLTAVNILGVKRGSLLVNIAAWAKIAAIAALVLLGLTIGRGDWSHLTTPAEGATVSGLSLLSAFGAALISVFFAFEGWIYVTWVAGEMKDAARDVPRALIIGLMSVAVIYALINLTYVYALPMPEIISADAVVAAASTAMFSPRAAYWFTLMVAISAFGAMSSAILSTARVFYAMAKDGLFFERMANVHPRFHTPAFSLIIQGIWASILAIIGLFDQLLAYCMFAMIVVYGVTVGALFVLRRKLPHHPRPYRCWGYPYVPAIYVLVVALWTVNTLVQRPFQSFAGVAIALLGIPGYLYWSRQRQNSRSETQN